MAELPSGTVTFLFTDLEVSTRLWDLEPDAMREALARHDDIWRGAVEAHGGVIVKGRGDGVHAAFATADGAVRAAIAGELGMAAEAWPVSEALRVRVGIHTGVAELREGDYFGSAVNRAARLEAIAHGGQIVCSQATADLVHESLPMDVGLVDLGEHRLRDLSRAERVFQVSAPGLAREFPPLRSVDAYPGNLPLQVTSFVGRRREIDRIAHAIEDSRVVTLTGVGGVGKTRLALEVAAGLLPDFQEGAWLVELAPVRDPDDVAAAFAAVFGVAPRVGISFEESLVEFLRSKQLLMVVDNCEHLLEAAAELISLFERSCANVVVLATSREGLAIDGERVVPVPSLPAPDPQARVESLGDNDSVALFVERARSADPDFQLTLQNGSAVAQICRRLDGVPLAIELAASQVSTMTADDLARGLDHRFETLAGGRRGAVERHQTLRAAIDWSHDLCSPREQLVLARLSVFAGGATREAAEAVCGVEPVESDEVFPALRGLVAKSLVVAERDQTQTRYRLLETIRAYAEDRLADANETVALRARHAEYYAAWVARISEEFETAQQYFVDPRIRAERENIVTAMNHAIDSNDVDLGLRLGSLLGMGGYAHGLPLESVVELPDAPTHPLYPLAVACLAGASMVIGDLDAAEQYIEQASGTRADLTAADALIDWNLAVARALIAQVAGNHRQAADYHQQAAQHSMTAGLPGQVTSDLGAAAFEAVLGGDRHTARRLSEQGLALARQAAIPSSIAMNLNALAGALVEDDPERAKHLLRESREQVKDAPVHADVQLQSLFVWAQLHEWDEALQLAAPAIRDIQWSTTWFNLIAICNVLARALVDSDPEAAAVIQGITRHFAGLYRTSVQPHDAPAGRRISAPEQSPPAKSENAGLLVDIRRDTTALLIGKLGNERLRELRAQGETMNNDQAVAYTLDAVARATTRSMA